MDNELYDLVYKGELVPGFELEQVKKNLQVLFRIDAAKIEVLFSGKAIPLKKGLDFAAVNKYRVAMKKAGARVDVIESQTAKVDAVKPSTPASQKASELGQSKIQGASNGSPQQNSPSAANASNSGLQTQLGAAEQKQAQPRPKIQAPDYSISSLSEDLLKDDEKAQFKELDLDLSALSVSEQSGNLVKEEELEKPESVEVADLQAELLPAGSDVLRGDEKTVVKKVEVDTSNLQMASVGERLSPEKKETAKAPNVDHIRLAD